MEHRGQKNEEIITFTINLNIIWEYFKYHEDVYVGFELKNPQLGA